MYYIDICYMLYADDQKVFFGIYWFSANKYSFKINPMP